MEDVKLERGDSLRITFKYTAILICFFYDSDDGLGRAKK